MNLLNTIDILNKTRLYLTQSFNGITYQEVLSSWWDEYQYRLSEGSIERKSSIIKNHLIPALGAYKVKDIDKALLKNYIDTKHKNELSYHTIRTHFNILRPSLDYAILQGIIYINPARGIRIPRPRKEIYPATFPEVIKILEHTESIKMKYAIIIAFMTGMRPGEIWGLKKSDIYFEQKFLTVRRSVVAPKPGDAIVHETKTASSRRRIDLDDLTLAILKVMVQGSQSDFLFVDGQGDLMSPWDIKVHFDKAANKAGIKNKRFYDLRHGHATYLLMHNINVKEIQERLGHSSIRTTIDTYGHLFPSIQQQTVNLLNCHQEGYTTVANNSQDLQCLSELIEI